MFVPAEYAIVGTKGTFVRDRHLRVRTPVVVRVWKDQMAVSLLGVICANYEDLGFAIHYTEKTESAALQLVTLLVTEFVSPSSKSYGI